MHDTFPALDLGAPASSHAGRWIALGGIVALVAAMLVAWAGVGQYNDLQTNDARLAFSWNQVINQYTRRADLVPNLVAVVRAYTRHEDALFTQIATTRTQLHGLAGAARSGDPQKLAQFQAAQSQLSTQLGRLLVVAERYPELTSAALYQDLMVQLEGTENRLAYARQQYFGSLADYNLGLRRFPGNLLAQRVGMHEKQPVDLADDRVVRPALPVEIQ